MQGHGATVVMAKGTLVGGCSAVGRARSVVASGEKASCGRWALGGSAHKEVARFHRIDTLWDDEPASGAHFLGQLVLQL